ncbi:MAG: hypothetical protein EXR77_14965 [Myxococcales bacterium]|nr:hypothetical protein [Myxococcales bacterium]
MIGAAGALAVACAEPVADPADSVPTRLFVADSPTTGLDSAGVDSTVVLDLGEVVAKDVAAVCPGGSGCSCASAGDCDNGLCIETPQGKSCAVNCTTQCPADYTCAQTTGRGGDIANVCVPRYGKLCNPCLNSAACAALGQLSAVCAIHGDAGAFCGASCDVDSQCPSGFGCAEVVSIEGPKAKQCAPVSTGSGTVGACACSPAASAAKLGTTCTAKAKDGSGGCPGVRGCGDNGLSACAGPEFKSETCDGVDNDCDGQTDEGTCDNSTACQASFCLALTGTCTTTQLDDGVLCDDSNACTGGDQCTAGKCGGKAIDCDDKNPCSADTCNLTKGCAHTNADGVGCDDENPCTIGEVCASGSCGAGKPKVCSVDQACTVAACDLTSGKCGFSAADDGLACDDGSLCSQSDNCSGGKCKGVNLNCDDSNICTNDGCDPKSGCKQLPASLACSDGNACTDGDGCKNGKCVGLAKTATACDDANPCTSDACDLALGCTHAANELPCDDGDLCTAKDLCKNGKCLAGAQVCSCQKDSDCAAKEDGDLCNGTLFCKLITTGKVCAINPTTVVECPSGADTACAKNNCKPADGICELAPVPDGQACDADNSLCTAKDACIKGKCIVGAPLNCGDGNTCTSEMCTPAVGCEITANSLPCDADGTACTANDKCVNTACIAGTALVCDDKKPCTKDGCNLKSGQCVFDTLAADASPCDADGSACTTQDQCKGGKCEVGAALNCDDKNVCTADTCHISSGCNHNPVKDNTFCGTGKICKAGVCGDATACNYGFDVTYGGPALEQASGIFAVAGGYVLAARTESAVGGTTDGWLVKVSDSGKLVWSTTLGGTANDGFNAVAGLDGGYVAAGGNQSKAAGEKGLWIARFDAGGTAMWDTSFGYPTAASAAGVAAVADGIVAAGSAVLAVKPFTFSAVVAKVNKSGAKLWNKAFGDASFTAIKAQGTTTAAIGWTGAKGAGGRDMWLVAFDNLGTISWDKTFGTAGHDEAQAVEALADGWLVAGHSVASGVKQLLVVRTDATGGKLWEKSYANQCVVKSVALVSPGFVLAGAANLANSAGGEDACAIRIDGMGTLLGSKSFDGGGSDEFAAVIAVKDSLVFAGGTTSKGAGWYDLWVVRTDGWFSPTCEDAGLCATLTAIDCDDGKVCTADWCAAGKGCTHVGTNCGP